MKRTTIFPDDALLPRVKQSPTREHKNLTLPMREPLQSSVEQQQPAADRFSFAGKYKSHRPAVSEKHEQLLWRNKR